jgi:hypothetical protein
MPQQQYILNRLPIGLVMLDLECRVRSFSGIAAEVFGDEQIRKSLGMTIRSLHPEQSHSKIEWLLEQSRKEHASDYASMLINVPNRILQLRIIQLSDEKGASGYCLILYDITDLTSLPKIEKISDSNAPGSRSLLKLPVSILGRIALMDIGNISYLRAEGHYTQVSAEGKLYFCNISLSQLETRLPEGRFLRVHRSYIINLAKASGVLLKDEQFVILICGTDEEKIPVSRAKVAQLRELFGV